MRSSFLYGSALLLFIILATASADRKWKSDEDKSEIKLKNRDSNKERKSTYSKANNLKKIENDDEMDNDNVSSEKEKFHDKKAKNRKSKQQIEDNSSEEVKSGGHKKFIGRIEHGKVKVLRRKEDNPENDKEKVCRNKKQDCNNNNHYDSDSDEDESNENNEKPKKKIKYSIKFAHEKQKKKDNGDITVMRIHKNGRKQYGKTDYDDSSEEDDKPLKRFHLMDDED